MRHEVRKPTPVLSFSGVLKRRSRTTRIILHHYHSANATPHDVHRWHLNKGWAGIGYNLTVDLDGTIWEGRGIDFVGAHAKGNNSDSIGIACQGRYDDHTTEMPLAQFNALVWLVGYLHGIYGNLPLFRHSDVNRTACPGRYFPWDELIRRVLRTPAAGSRFAKCDASLFIVEK